jgi:hypothetical protein
MTEAEEGHRKQRERERTRAKDVYRGGRERWRLKDKEGGRERAR